MNKHSEIKCCDCIHKKMTSNAYEHGRGDTVRECVEILDDIAKDSPNGFVWRAARFLEEKFSNLKSDE